MRIRILLATLALGSAIVLYSTTASVRAPWLELAARGLGERAYAVRLKHLPVGQLVQGAHRLPTGNYRFTSNLEFQLAQGQPVRVFETKIFSGVAPFELLSANQTDTTAASRHSVEIKRVETKTVELSAAEKAASYTTSYTTKVTRGTDLQSQPLSWRYRLSDYLAVEHWLSQAAIDDVQAFTSIDFDSLELRRDVWSLLAKTEEGYEVSKSSQLEATRLFLDQQYKPLRFSMAGTFEIETIDEALLPIEPEPVFHSRTYQVSVNEPIDNHQSLGAMTLAVKGNTDLVEQWESAKTDEEQVVLRSFAETKRPSVPNDAQRYSREELSYPLSATSVKELATLAVDPVSTPLEQARQLTSFVHNYIDYDHHSTMQNVLDVISNQIGDCNEYAELYTTLGRALGLPVRTVIGLAYTNEFAPAFALHAWNEVLLDGSWTAFDPTWNQTRVDATHLPLPDNAEGMLAGITSLDELNFEIKSLRY